MLGFALIVPIVGGAAALAADHARAYRVLGRAHFAEERALAGLHAGAQDVAAAAALGVDGGLDFRLEAL